MADTKQALDAPPSWLEWLREQRGSAQSGVLPVASVRAFCARLSQRQQRDDVARGNGGSERYAR